MQGSAREDRNVDGVAQTPEAVLPAAGLALEQEIEEVPILDSSTSNYQPPDNLRPPSPAAPDWQSVNKCVECVLEDRGIVTRLYLPNSDSDQVWQRHSNVFGDILSF